jgi:hypothetical protein
MNRLANFAIVMTVFSVVSAFGQTRVEIEAKFGQPVKAYSVSKSIWMSPEYASNGQVCRMTFYPRRFSSTTHYLINELPFNEFGSVIDVIVPVALRGAQKEPFRNGMWDGGGGVRWTNFTYEKVTISYVASFRIINKGDTGEFVNLDLPDDQISKPEEKRKQIKEDYSLYSGSTAEIVTVHWNNRKCSVNKERK